MAWLLAPAEDGKEKGGGGGVKTLVNKGCLEDVRAIHRDIISRRESERDVFAPAGPAPPTW